MVDEGWGNAAAVWAYTSEPRFRPEYDAVLSALDVGPMDRYLDIACGSGLAAQIADERGAAVSGIDASHRLVAIAEARVPRADFRTGDMHDLPWDSEAFDSATSFRGIWGNTPDALIQAARAQARWASRYQLLARRSLGRPDRRHLDGSCSCVKA